MQLRPDDDRITAWCQLERCAAQTDKLGLESRVQAYLEILKHPQCIREGRKAVIQGLEKVVKEDFTPEGTEEPDVLAVLEWVKGRNAKGWKLNLRRAGD
jgi:hypothetical protein